MEEKKCSKCGEVKPISEFGNLRGKVGGMSQCKVCNRKRGKEHNDKNTDKIKLYYLKNRERIIKRVCDNNKKNPRTEYMRDYQRKRYNTETEFRFMEQVRTHLKGVKNRKEFLDIWGDTYQVYDFYGIPYHIDHKVPKSWFLVRTPKSLINHMDNLQVIDKDYNLSKNNRWSDPVPSEYLDKIRPYIKKKFQGLLKSL